MKHYLTKKDADRLAEIASELKKADKRQRALEVEVTRILCDYELTAHDMGDEVFEFVNNIPHDVKALLQPLDLLASTTPDERLSSTEGSENNA